MENRQAVKDAGAAPHLNPDPTMQSKETTPGAPSRPSWGGLGGAARAAKTNARTDGLPPTRACRNAAFARGPRRGTGMATAYEGDPALDCLKTVPDGVGRPFETPGGADHGGSARCRIRKGSVTARLALRILDFGQGHLIFNPHNLAA